MADPNNTKEPIAIVGLGCVLPGAHQVDAFWRHTLSAQTALRPLSGPHWEASLDASLVHSDRLTPKHIASIEGYTFDWRHFRIPPTELAESNPLQFMVLDAGSQALGSLKVLPQKDTGILLGATGLGWQRDSGLRIRLADLCNALSQSPSFRDLSKDAQTQTLCAIHKGLDKELRPVSEDNVINASASVAAGRIAMFFDLHGPHLSIDASFASALAAMEMACRLLEDGTLDLALCGGVSELITPLEIAAMAAHGLLGKNEIRPFDAAMQGTLLGEGVALFALKRLADARRDGETIYAVVRGVTGVTQGDAPTETGLNAAQKQTYKEAGVDPDTVGLWECDAPGILRYELAEIRALGALLSHATGGTQRAYLGASKDLVGHTRAAAGAVSLLRATLCLYHKQIPQVAGHAEPHPALELSRVPLQIPTRTIPFVGRGGPLRAGINALGLFGICYHALLEEAPQPPQIHDGGQRQNPRPPVRQPKSPVAITGMGGLFPGAPDVASLVRLLHEGGDTTTEIPGSRWPLSAYYDPDPQRRETSYTKLGCFLSTLPNGQLPQIDPAQELALLSAEEALADCHYRPGIWDPKRVAVVLAFLPYQGKKFLADLRMHYAWFARELDKALSGLSIPNDLRAAIRKETEDRAKAGLPPITEATLPGYSGSVVAGRIAKKYGFSGPHMVVDSACASSHAALLLGMRLLLQGRVDTVLCGGVWCDILPEFYVASCRFQALSKTGSHPFSSRADGFVPGEGGGIFVLRRQEDAEENGETIHALLRSVAGSSDGRGRSVLAPSEKGEALSMSRALSEAGISPDSVAYVECHGTGTPLGDVVEAEACSRAYGQGRSEPLLIGSVKSNIGHLNAAAGVPALIKAVMAVKQGVIPPSLKAGPASNKIDFAKGRLQVVSTLTPWPQNQEGLPRRAGVSGFGVGGTNMHLIVEEHLKAKTPPKGIGNGGDFPLLSIFTASGSDLRSCLHDLQGAIHELGKGVPFAAVLEKSQEAAQKPGRRVAIVAADAATLESRVGLLASTLARGDQTDFLQTQGIFCGPPWEQATQVAVLFPGQGPQYASMLSELATRFPLVQEALSEIDRLYEELCGKPLSPSFLHLPKEAPPPEGEDSHCAVFAVNYVLFRLLKSYGLRPQALLGQSAGELAALVCASVLSLKDGLAAMRARTLSVCNLALDDPGQMVSLGCSAADAERLFEGLSGQAYLAADNAPKNCIVSGDSIALGPFLARCTKQGISATRLAVSHAYHSPIIAFAKTPYHKALTRLHFASLQIPVVSTITGAPLLPLSPGEFADHLASQFTKPVLLRQGIEALYQQGIRLFVECGPRWPLTNYVGQILSDRPHIAQATLHPKVGEIEQLHRSLACLFVHRAVTLQPTTHTEHSSMEHEQEQPKDVLDLLRNIQALIGAFLKGQEASPKAPTAPSVDKEPPLAPEPPLGALGKVSLVASFEQVRDLLLAELMAKTGYPADMLDLDLDMEADLGIDTVRQVAIIAEVRTRLGLPLEEGFKLRDYPTIRKVVTYLVERLGTKAQTTPLVETNAVRSSLEAQIQAAASPLSPPPHLAPPRVAPLIPVQAGGAPLHTLLLSARRRKSGGLLYGLDQVRIGAEGPNHPSHPNSPEPFGLREQGSHFQLIAGAKGQPESVVIEGHVLIGTPDPAVPPALMPEVASAIDRRRGRPLNGVALFSAAHKAGAGKLQEQLHGETLIWAWSSRFDEVTGGIRLLSNPNEPQDAHLLALLWDGVFWLADYGWYTLSGALYEPASVRRVRLFRALEPGEELRVFVRLTSSTGGHLSADAQVVDGAQAVLATLDGIAGRPMAETKGADPAEAEGNSWQHFYRRMHQVQLPGEDHAW